MKNSNYLPDEGIYKKYQHKETSDIFSRAAGFAEFVKDGRSRGDDVYSMPVIEYRGGRALVDGGSHYGKKEVVVMCSADYLGLAHHQDIIESGINALKEYGTNVASVPIFGGRTSVHDNFEKALAEFLGTEDCVLFPTGYAANMGAIQAICTENDTVVLDKLCHYSVLDGIYLSRAQKKTFLHSDAASLEKILSETRKNKKSGGILIIVEGVYGIDGEVTPLKEISRLAEKYGARIMIDEAHGLGVIGKTGRGASEYHHMEKTPDIIVGSLSKSLAAPGGFIACRADVADYVRYFARTAVFSAGLQTASPAVAGAALRNIRENPALIEKLQHNAGYLRHGLKNIGFMNASVSQSAIMSIMVGSEDHLRNVSRDLFINGIWAEALTYPAVEPGQARIRFRVSTAHTKEDLDFVLKKVAEILS
jgi:glycine C-acetyltransferase